MSNRIKLLGPDSYVEEVVYISFFPNENGVYPVVGWDNRGNLSRSHFCTTPDEWAETLVSIGYKRVND